MSSPERIFVPTEYRMDGCNDELPSVEYIRADIHEARVAELETERKKDFRFMQGVLSHLLHNDINAALGLYETRALALNAKSGEQR